jgi:hypothetical protein
MDLSKLFIKDPKQKEPSVSLTMLVIAFIVAVVAAGLDMAGKVKSTSVTLELFWGVAALYFGRRATLPSKSVIDEKTKEGSQ